MPLNLLKSLLFGLLLCSVPAASEEEYCEAKTKRPMDHLEDFNMENTFEHDDIDLGLKELFFKDDINDFIDTTSNFRSDIFDDEAMKSMYRSFEVGSLPEQLEGKGFEVMENQTGQYEFSTGRYGYVRTLIYGKFNKTCMGGNYSSISFNWVEGNMQQMPYKTGHCIYGHFQYVKNDDMSGKWVGSITGIFLLRLPNKQYYIHGIYDGYTQGKIDLFKGPTLRITGITLGLADNAQHSARSVTNLAGTSTLGNVSYAFDMESLTDGTNTTMWCFYKLHPESPETTLTWNGRVEKQGHKITVAQKSKGYVRTDKEDFFSDTNLGKLFNLLYSSVGLELA